MTIFVDKIVKKTTVGSIADSLTFTIVSQMLNGFLNYSISVIRKKEILFNYQIMKDNRVLSPSGRKTKLSWRVILGMIYVAKDKTKNRKNRYKHREVCHYLLPRPHPPLLHVNIATRVL